MPGAYRVCLLTGDAGEDASGRHDNPDLLGHTYVGPYLAADDGPNLVVVDSEGVCGYLLATADTTRFERWREAEWLPALRAQYPIGSGTPRDGELTGLLHHPPCSPPELLTDHPAHLHIDLLPRAQGQGWGRRLMDHLADTLQARGVRGVHLGVSPDNARARGFYARLGYRELLQGDDVIYLGLGLRRQPPP
ncbi:MAG: GNAT family N-acetyltransferase [Kineosporiaceae bacterium]|nr:GNAT family N-acetyltransferase [Kineosporiaceae bacterium]